MKKLPLIVALSASLIGGVALAQTQPQSRPYSDTKPEATKPMDTGSAPSLAELDRNRDGAVDKQEAKASPSVAASFDKADTNKDGKLSAAELNATATMTKTK